MGKHAHRKGRTVKSTKPEVNVVRLSRENKYEKEKKKREANRAKTKELLSKGMNLAEIQLMKREQRKQELKGKPLLYTQRISKKTKLKLMKEKSDGKKERGSGKKRGKTLEKQTKIKSNTSKSSSKSYRQPYNTGVGQYTEAGIPIGWDKTLHLVHSMPEIMDREIIKDSKANLIENKEDNPEQKSQKLNKKAKKRALEAAVKAIESGSDINNEAIGNALWMNYQPKLITCYNWIREEAYKRETHKHITNQQTPLEYTAELMARLQIPGEASYYKKPELPLTLKPKKTIQTVDKSPVLAILIAAMNGKNPISLNKSADQPTFVCFRHSIRHMLLSLDDWRVDIQRYKNYIFLRRYTDYHVEDIGDIGHLFEDACKLNTQQHQKQFRSVVQGKVGKFNILASMEVDIVRPTENKNNTDDNLSQEYDVKQFLELKTVTGKPNMTKLQNIWLQCYLAGVSTVVIATKPKQPVISSNNNAKTAQGSRKPPPPPCIIEKIVEQNINGLINDKQRAQLFEQLHRIFTMISDKVEENKIYKLCRERKDSAKTICLYEIEGGINQFPIINDTIMEQINKQNVKINHPNITKNNVNSNGNNKRNKRNVNSNTVTATKESNSDSESSSSSSSSSSSYSSTSSDNSNRIELKRDDDTSSSSSSDSDSESSSSSNSAPSSKKRIEVAQSSKPALSSSKTHQNNSINRPISLNHNSSSSPSHLNNDKSYKKQKAQQQFSNSNKHSVEKKHKSH